MSRNERVFIPDVLKFYVPLAATSVLMMITHSVISRAVSQSANPAPALAAYTAAYSVGQIFESPCYGMQRMGLTFIKGKSSSALITRISVSILAVLIGAYALAAFTPIASYIFKNLLRVPPDVYPIAVASLQVFIGWPLSSAIRSVFQAQIVLAKRTYWMTVNMFARVAMMFGAALLLPRVWPNGPVGAAVLVTGITTEAALAWAVAKFAIPRPGEDPPDEPLATGRQVLGFALPLSLASSLQTFGRPVLTAALLRTVNPTVTLAGYQVAASFSYILTALTYNIYHMVVVFVKDAASFRRMQMFCLSLGVIGFVLMGLCSIPAVGKIVFGRIIAAPPDIAQEATRTLSALTLTAPASAAMEFFSGTLMMRKRASTVTLTRLANTASVCGIVIVLVKVFPSIGGTAAGIALSVGPFIEAAISYRIIRTSPEFADLFKTKDRLPAAQSAGQ